MSIRWLAIINPYAGHSRSTNWQEEFSAKLRHELGAEVVFTQYHGHATELARSSTADGLAVFGGDGTIAEVVNGMDLDKQKLLLLAGGTGNGLARDLELTSFEQALVAARQNRIRLLDLIKINFRIKDKTSIQLAISTASVGYAAEVVVLANRYFKKLGNLCYPLSATLQAARQKSFSLKVSIDDGEFVEQPLSNVMVNNTRHAGNFSAFRASNLTDGLMEVLLAKAGFASQFLHNLAVLSKTYFYQTATEIKARKINLVLPSPQKLMIDGELWEGVTEVDFEILPQKLQCVV